MLKEIRSKVMQIANILVKLGQVRACATATAWKIVKSRGLGARVAGTTFDNRQNVLALLTKYDPADVDVQLVREPSNAFDSNAVAVTVSIKDKVRILKIGYLPKRVAAVISVLMDKGFEVPSDTLSVVGGYDEYTNYGSRIIIR